MFHYGSKWPSSSTALGPYEPFPTQYLARNGPQGNFDLVYTNKWVAWAAKNFVWYRRKNYRTNPNQNFHAQSPTT